MVAEPQGEPVAQRNRLALWLRNPARIRSPRITFDLTLASRRSLAFETAPFFMNLPAALRSARSAAPQPARWLPFAILRAPMLRAMLGSRPTTSCRRDRTAEHEDSAGSRLHSRLRLAPRSRQPPESRTVPSIRSDELFGQRPKSAVPFTPQQLPPMVWQRPAPRTTLQRLSRSPARHRR